MGALIISSLMVVPVAAAMAIARSYKTTVIWAAFVAVCSTLGGLVLSFYMGLKPGGTIVLIAVAFFLVFRLIGVLGGKRRASGVASDNASKGDA